MSTSKQNGFGIILIPADLDLVVLQEELPGVQHAFWLFVVVVPSRQTSERDQALGGLQLEATGWLHLANIRDVVQKSSLEI